MRHSASPRPLSCAALAARQGIAEDLPKLKLLLVISRPDGSEDVAFRTIASTVLHSLRASPNFQAVVLRPPTYEELARVLRDAANDGDPYDLVHFDGHGFYHAHPVNGSADENVGGYIVFEDNADEGGHAVSGAEFAALASECGVRAGVLNACRSAYQEPNDNADSSRARPAASFAYSLLTAGVPAVVAMNFNVYVVSAKRFMEEFYRQLERGQTLSVAASLARKHLSTDRTRVSPGFFGDRRLAGAGDLPDRFRTASRDTTRRCNGASQTNASAVIPSSAGSRLRRFRRRATPD